MKRQCRRIAALLLICLLCLPAPAVAEPGGPAMLRVGLYYTGSASTPALPTANLENSIGSGYRLGYFDDALNFYTLALTERTQISVLKTTNVYLSPDLTYSDTKPAAPLGVVGEWHVELPGIYSDYAAVQPVAAALPGGFVAWIDGTYRVRVGAFETEASAEQARTALGTAEAAVVGTSKYAVTVTETKTTNVLFQFDGGTGSALGIVPVGAEDEQPLTWFKGYQYFGAFRYERVGGGNLTVVNVISVEDYLRGLLPYEMSSSWPLEALKAQAVCARTYAISNLDKHKNQHFDICATTDCQVYHGANKATAHTDRAVLETYGEHVRYQGSLAQTFYYSCNGGATEDCKNVWEADLPYLKGKIDPYEPTIQDKTGHYGWQYTFSKAKLTQMLRDKGYDCGEVVDFHVAARTPTDNVATITFVDANGKRFSFSKDRARTFLGVKSIRFTIDGSTGGYSINGVRSVGDTAGLYAIGGGGSATPLPQQPYVLTGDGKTNSLTPPVTTDVYTVTGSGWGHQVGMSQWGAYAMAQQGLSYRDILTFYFTGVEVY